MTVWFVKKQTEPYVKSAFYYMWIITFKNEGTVNEVSGLYAIAKVQKKA